MPKLVNKNPKLGKNGIYAVVRYKGKTHRLERIRNWSGIVLCK